ncbi:SDR family oxidoreductase [Streptomyces sp. V4I23]|uniref:SDR family oxidoreductase n=1 Tax=Streptomyces sp. V4I23 TaxID=3042282 RepID=UPI00358F623F
MRLTVPRWPPYSVSLYARPGWFRGTVLGRETPPCGWRPVLLQVSQGRHGLVGHRFAGLRKAARVVQRYDWVVRGHRRRAPPQHRRSGVTVNSVLSGPTHTEGIEEYITALIPEAESFVAAQREFIARFRPTSLIQRPIQPSEVADLILFTSSDRASATTGAALKVEGSTLTSLTP